MQVVRHADRQTNLLVEAFDLAGRFQEALRERAQRLGIHVREDGQLIGEGPHPEAADVLAEADLLQPAEDLDHGRAPSLGQLLAHVPLEAHDDAADRVVVAQGPLDLEAHEVDHLPRREAIFRACGLLHGRWGLPLPGVSARGAPFEHRHRHS